jgi:leucyl-tRNA synthetase
MYALVVDNSVTRVFPGPKGFEHNGNQYAPDIFYKWSKAEKEAIGLYEVETDSTNYKDENWYINTNESFTFGSGKVTRSWGTATAKDHADKDAVDSEGNKIKDEDGNQVIIEGLKTILIRTLKQQAAGELQNTDWYVIRKADAGTAIPSSISTHRAAVRTKCAEMETAITNAVDTPALETLYTYTKQEDGSVTRPLGELPRLED